MFRGLTLAFLSHSASIQVRTITLYSLPYMVPPTLALTLTPELSKNSGTCPDLRVQAGVCCLCCFFSNPLSYLFSGWSQDAASGTHGGNTKWEFSDSSSISSVQFSSVVQSCPTLCDPMNRSMPGLPVHHHLPEFTQIHIHQVGDAIQPSHLLSSPFPPAPNPSQHQSLFQ